MRRLADVSLPSPTRLHWWQWPTVLSLDAPAVVVVWQWLFAAAAGVAVGWRETAVVGLSVWLAYAADRSLETWLVPAKCLVTPRHQFYARFRPVIVTVWVAVLMVDVGIAVFGLSRNELAAGALLLVPTTAYVMSHQFLHRQVRGRLPKELCIALLIAGGATVFVLANMAHPIALIAPGILFAALCFTNVTLISVWEAEVDRTQGQTSLAHQFRSLAPIARMLPLGVAGLAAIASAPVFNVAPIPAHCVAASAVLLALLDRFEPKLGWRAARVLADVALLTPLVPLARGLRW